MSYHVAISDATAQNHRQILWTTGVADFVMSNAQKRSKKNANATFICLNDDTPIAYFTDGVETTADNVVFPKVKKSDIVSTYLDALSNSEVPIDDAPSQGEAADAFMLSFYRAMTKDNKGYKNYPFVAQTVALEPTEEGKAQLMTLHYVNGQRVDAEVAQGMRQRVSQLLTAATSTFGAIWDVDHTRLPKGFPTMLRPLLTQDSRAETFEPFGEELSKAAEFIRAALPSVQSAQGAAMLAELVAVIDKYAVSAKD